MKTRREFIRVTATGALAAGLTPLLANSKSDPQGTKGIKPIVISTWRHGLPANEAAWKILSNGGRALDAVEKGVMVVEADMSNSSVGLGGLPDRDGRVTLDACIMNEKGDAGSVACIEHIMHPISVARMVMEKTPHVMLVADGALQFALSQGFEKIKRNMTPESENAWKEWLKTSKYKPIINIENHDTIGMVALDSDGNLSGSCTTSGLAYKMHGRVGDSPIIGAGLYVDNEIGAACATGLGEAVIKICGSFLVVELMRQGMSPAEACKTAVERITKRQKNIKDLQVGFIAINKNGETGCYAIHSGFNYAKYDSEGNVLIDSDHYME